EVLQEVSGAGVPVRLKQRQHSTSRGARRVQRRLDFGRMMAVVVDHQDAALLTLYLESAFCSSKLAERSGDLLELDVQIEAYGNCGQRVIHVVKARHSQFHLSHLFAEGPDAELSLEVRVGLDLPGRNIGLRRQPIADSAAGDLRYDRLHVLIVQT